MNTITAKLGNMRKAVEWVVYPAGRIVTSNPNGSITIQSDHRIASFDPKTGRGYLSAHKGAGAYFMHLQPFLGATEVLVPRDVIVAALAAQPQSGDEIGPGVTIA